MHNTASASPHSASKVKHTDLSASQDLQQATASGRARTPRNTLVGAVIVGLRSCTARVATRKRAPFEFLDSTTRTVYKHALPAPSGKHSGLEGAYPSSLPSQIAPTTTKHVTRTTRLGAHEPIQSPASDAALTITRPWRFHAGTSLVTKS